VSLLDGGTGSGGSDCSDPAAGITLFVALFFDSAPAGAAEVSAVGRSTRFERRDIRLDWHLSPFTNE
jgi:hypothetical protein